MRNLLNIFSKKPTEANFTDYLADGTPVSTVDQRLAFLFGGTTISRREAMKVPAVARGIHALTILATLNLATKDKTNTTVSNSLIDQIDPDVPNNWTLTKTAEDIVFHGRAYWLVTQRSSSDGRPLNARYIPFTDIRVEEVKRADGYTKYNYYINSHLVPNSQNIIRFDSPRDPLLDLVSQTVRQSLALQSTMEGFAKNPAPKMLFSPKSDVDVNPDKIKAALEKFTNDRRDNPFAYVGAALDATPVQLLSPAELQLIESDKSVALAIANFFDLDPDQIGLATGDSNTYNNAVDRRIDRRTNQLQWLATAIEQRLSMPDITPRGYRVEFNFNDLLRVDPKTQAEIAQIEFANGTTTVSEYRQQTGRAPLTMEQLQEINMMKQMALPAQPEPLKVQASVGNELTTFSEEESEAVTFEQETGEFTDVNANSRTVTVLAVPYGQLANGNISRPIEFAQGSLHWQEPSRVKLLRDHDYTISVGHAIDIQETERGLVATFKVPNGSAGDKALADFANKTHDGVSVGVKFEDIVNHPSKPGAYLVRKAKLREVSQVAIPSFDDSRVMSVQFSDQPESINEGEIQMSDETKNETPDVAKLVADSVAAAFAAHKEETTPVVIDPFATTTATAAVVKEPLYRFDGQEGRFSFSKDLYDSHKGDAKAKERVDEYMSGEFAVAITNTTALNPTIQTGNYVDQRDYEYPIWNAIKKGDVPNRMQPFGWVQYNASSTLMAAHVEGTEPTLGSGSVAAVTVTPTMSSGKIEVNREVWEMRGKPAVDQLLNGLFVRAYNESLESAVVTFLEAATLTEVTLQTNAVDDALVDQLTGTLIDLLTVRGGNTMTDLFLNGTLYKLLAQAKDADKRYLLPAVGPANATGTALNRFRGLDVNGIVGVPAWALPTSTSASKNSYLLDRAAVSGWASPLTIDTFDVQVKSVYIGAWGVSAFAVNDAAGVRRLKYDPTT